MVTAVAASCGAVLVVAGSGNKLCSNQRHIQSNNDPKSIKPPQRRRRHHHRRTVE